MQPAAPSQTRFVHLLVTAAAWLLPQHKEDKGQRTWRTYITLYRLGLGWTHSVVSQDPDVNFKVEVWMLNRMTYHARHNILFHLFSLYDPWRCQNLCPNFILPNIRLVYWYLRLDGKILTWLAPAQIQRERHFFLQVFIWFAVLHSSEAALKRFHVWSKLWTKRGCGTPAAITEVFLNIGG